MATVIARGNLETRAQDMQMRVGLGALAVSLIAAMLLTNGGTPPAFRALAFVPFFVASYGVLASLYRTCGFTAMAGRRITSDGAEPVADRDEMVRLRARGIRVLMGSVALAIAATSLLVVAS